MSLTSPKQEDGIPKEGPQTKGSLSICGGKGELGLGLRFDTRYHEQTGYLEAFRVGVEKFVIDPGTNNKFYQRNDYNPSEDESGWEGPQQDTLHFVDPKVRVSDLVPGTMIHVVFHFHDNYCDASNAFLDRQKAERFFLEMQDNMWKQVDELRAWNTGYDFCLMKHDQWHCDLLECELTGRPYGRTYINQPDGWTRPDKGDTWWLRSVALEE